MIREYGYRSRAITQGRHFDVENIQPVEQIFAKSFGGNSLLEIFVARGNDPHIDADVFCTADPAHGFFFQNPQQAHLRLFIHGGDFIEKYGPAIGCSKIPGRESCAPVNAPRSWPKISLAINSGAIAPILTAT